MLKIGDRVNADCLFEGREFVDENGVVVKFNKYTNVPYIEFDSGIKGWYIEERYLTKLKSLKYKVGDRIVVNGSNDGKGFCNAIGTIIKTTDRYQPYLVKFDDYSILNGSREGWWVRGDQVTAHVDYLAVGTLVKVCGFDYNGIYYSQEGKISRVDRGDKDFTYQVGFPSGRSPWFRTSTLTVIEPSTSTQKYTTVWSKNPYQIFSVYDNITGEVIARFHTFGEADDYIKSITQRYAQRFSITI